MFYPKRCASEVSQLLRIDLDGLAADYEIEVRDTTFTSPDPKGACYSRIPAVSVLVRCAAENNSVIFERVNFTNLVAEDGSGLQVRA